MIGEISRGNDFPSSGAGPLGPYSQVRVAVPVTVVDVFCTPLFTVTCKFSGAVAMIVTAPDAIHFASPFGPMLAAVVDVFHERPSTCES